MTPEELRKQERENQKYFSGQVSDLCRYIGFGLVGAAFTLLSNTTSGKPHLAEAQLGIAAIAGCAAVLLDYLQMIFGFMAASTAAENKEGGYTKSAASKNWGACQIMAFVGKQLAAFLGSLVLIYAIGQRLDVF